MKRFLVIPMTLLCLSLLTACGSKEPVEQIEETPVESIVEEDIEMEDVTDVYYDSEGNELTDISSFTGDVYDVNLELVGYFENGVLLDTSDPTTEMVSDGEEITLEDESINTDAQIPEVQSIIFKFKGRGPSGDDLSQYIEGSFIRNSKVMIPLNSLTIFDPNIAVEFDEIRNVVKMSKGSDNYTMYINDSTIYKNGLTTTVAEAIASMENNIPVIPMVSFTDILGIPTELDETNLEVTIG